MGKLTKPNQLHRSQKGENMTQGFTPSQNTKETLKDQRDFLRRFINIMLGLSATTTIKIMIDLIHAKMFSSGIKNNFTIFGDNYYFAVSIVGFLVFVFGIRFFYGLYCYISTFKDYQFRIFFFMCAIQSIIFTLHSFSINFGVFYVLFVLFLALLVDSFGFTYILKLKNDPKLNSIQVFISTVADTFLDLYSFLIKSNDFIILIFLSLLLFLFIYFLGNNAYPELQLIFFFSSIVMVFLIFNPAHLNFFRNQVPNQGTIEGGWAANNFFGFLILGSVLYFLHPLTLDKKLSNAELYLLLIALAVTVLNSWIGLSKSITYYTQ